jgi:hypothetical protein
LAPDDLWLGEKKSGAAAATIDEVIIDRVDLGHCLNQFSACQKVLSIKAASMPKALFA